MKYDPFDKILSNKAKKNKKEADEKPYFNNTHDVLGLYKNPKLAEEENEDEEDEEKHQPKGFALLKRVYKDPCWDGHASNNSKKGGGNCGKVIENYSKIVNHLEEHLNEKAGDPKDATQSKFLRKEIKRINEGDSTPANKIKKSDPLYKVSNPNAVQKQAFELYGKDAIVYKSDKPNKKYKILNPDGKWVYFGQMKPPMEDFFKHQDLERRKKYIARASNIKGNWRKDIYSPNYLSLVLLWDAD